MSVNDTKERPWQKKKKKSVTLRLLGKKEKKRV